MNVTHELACDQKNMLASQTEQFTFYEGLKNLLRNIVYERRFQIPLLIVVGTVLYLPLFDNWYSGLAGDDNWMVYENPFIANLRLQNIREYGTSFYMGQYSPVNTLMYGIVYHFFGLDPFYFHLLSFALHVCNALLVLLFIGSVQLLRYKDVIRTSTEHQQQRFVAFIVALLFLTHPIQVESVVWVSASKVLLYSLFFLTGLIFYLKYVSTGRLWYFFITVVCFVLSFGAKEQALGFPLVLISIDLFVNRPLTNPKVIFEKLPFAILAILFGLVSLSAQEIGFSHKLANDYYPLGQRIVLACFSYTEYIIKLCVPLNLSYWYAFPIQPGERLPLRFYFYVLVAIVYAYFFIRWCLSKRYVFIFGNMFFMISIFLTLHIVPMARDVIMADRYLYLGSVGLFYVAAYYFAGVLKCQPKAQKRFTFALLLLIYISALSTYTSLYIDRWNIN
jgi:hypothetical protein